MAKEEKKTAKKVEKKNINKKTVKKTEKKQKAPKESYFKGVKKEMSLVKWPTWKEVIKNTIATVVLVVIIVVFFLLLNLGLSVIKGWFV